MSQSETIEGYIVDIACMRKYPHQELFDRARRHTRDCSLMGHCIESGYGLVNENDVTLIDDHATPLLVEAVSKSNKREGIRLRVIREMQDGEMRTTSVDELP